MWDRWSAALDKWCRNFSYENCNSAPENVLKQLNLRVSSNCWYIKSTVCTVVQVILTHLWLKANNRVTCSTHSHQKSFLVMRWYFQRFTDSRTVSKQGNIRCSYRFIRFTHIYKSTSRKRDTCHEFSCPVQLLRFLGFHRLMCVKSDFVSVLECVFSLLISGFICHRMDGVNGFIRAWTHPPPKSQRAAICC